MTREQLYQALLDMCQEFGFAVERDEAESIVEVAP